MLNSSDLGNRSDYMLINEDEHNDQKESRHDIIKCIIYLYQQKKYSLSHQKNRFIWFPEGTYEEILRQILVNICNSNETRIQYFESKFKLEDICSWDIFVQLTQSDLKEIGFKIGERIKFRKFLYYCKIIHNLTHKSYKYLLNIRNKLKYLNE